MPGRKRPPSESAAATGAADEQMSSSSNPTPTNGSKSGARSPARRPTRARSQTAKAKAGATAGNGNGGALITTVTEPIESLTRERGMPEAEIRARAYEIYLSRGGVDGDPVADWLAAERQVLGKGNDES